MTAINSNRAIRGPVTAVPVVAGKGVRIVPDTVNNRFVVEADETVLWEGSYESTGSITLSESFKNFELVRVEFISNDNISFTSIFTSAEQTTAIELFSCFTRSAVTGLSLKASHYTLTNTTITFSRGYEVAVGQSATQTSGNKLIIKRIVGINRISST
jgi:hypothetical protein